MLHHQRAPALSAGQVGAEEKTPPRAPVCSPGCPHSWAPARAHGPSGPAAASPPEQPLPDPNKMQSREPWGRSGTHLGERMCLEPGTQPATAPALQGGDRASRPATAPPAPTCLQARLRPAPPRLHSASHQRTDPGSVGASGWSRGPGRSPGTGSPSTCAAGPWRPRLSSALSRWRGAGRSPPGSCPAQCPAGRGWQWGWEAGVLPGSAGNSR